MILSQGHNAGGSVAVFIGTFVLSNHFLKPLIFYDNIICFPCNIDNGLKQQT